MLSSEQVAHYRRHGYVVARGLVTDAEVALLRAAVRLRKFGTEQIRRRAQVVELALAARAADRRFRERTGYRYRPWIAAAGNGAAADPATVLRTAPLAL